MKTLLLSQAKRGFLIHEETPLPQETICLKIADFGSGLFSENPKSPAPFALRACLRKQAGGGLSQEWNVVGAGQGSRVAQALSMPG